jgi:hypothetical protein
VDFFEDEVDDEVEGWRRMDEEGRNGRTRSIRINGTAAAEAEAEAADGVGLGIVVTEQRAGGRRE